MTETDKECLSETRNKCTGNFKLKGSSTTNTEITRFIWNDRYRYRNDGKEIIDLTLQDTWRRVARAIARVETNNQRLWENNFYHVLNNFQFIPGGRILAGAGVDRPVTLMNCFVMGGIQDPETFIIKSLRESASTLQQGGGIGCDFSRLLPRGMAFNHSYANAPGPILAMYMWDEMCSTTYASTRSLPHKRHGAMMATLRCDHPDIEDFIWAKKNGRDLHNFNLSILISDDFMAAVERDDLWSLVFPSALITPGFESGEQLMRQWSGEKKAIPCKVIKRLPARKLWDDIIRANYHCAEPGILFIDRINRLNNLQYCETISCTNPCSEVPLPAYGTCDLGSINLTRFVHQPFTRHSHLDLQGIHNTTAIATRMLDNVIDLSTYPLHEQHEQALGARRLGLGVVGLADTFIQLGLHYASPEAQHLAITIMKTIRDSAYRSSIDLAREKKPFPFFNAEHYLRGDNLQTLAEDIRASIARSGIRNSHLTAIAPTGTISLLAGNISGGIEPIFGYQCQHEIFCGMGMGTGSGIGQGNGTGNGNGKGGNGKEDEKAHIMLNNFSYQLWLDQMGTAEPLPEYFVTAHALSPDAHLNMVAAIQPYIDNSISKTVNVPEDISFPVFESIYKKAFQSGLKGCSTFRYNSITAAPVKRP